MMKNYNIKSLQEYFATGKTVKYIFFWGHTEKPGKVTKACFSQWYQSPFEHKGIVFKTAEHYMMVEKARLFSNDQLIEQIVDAKDPGKAKALGRQVVDFNADIWDKHKYQIVIAANQYKFEQNPELKDFLLSTKERVLVEASPVDKIWGIGLAQDYECIENPYKWKGENLLGFALMQVRDVLGANESSL